MFCLGGKIQVMNKVKKIISIFVAVISSAVMLCSLMACAHREKVDEPVGCYSNNWKVVTAPTEESEGVATAICSDCGQLKVIILPELDAMNGNVPVYTKESNVVSCEQGGIEKYTYKIPTNYLPNDAEWKKIVDEAADKDIQVTDEDRQTSLVIDVKVEPGSHYLSGTSMEDIKEYSEEQGVKREKKKHYFNPDVLKDSNGLYVITEFPDHVAQPGGNGLGYYICSECGTVVLVNTYRPAE